jgi:molybdate transport system regulatory protein
MVERTNNLYPKVLIRTATGGSKGGGTQLTSAGQALLTLFTRLEQQHNAFLQQLNQSLADDPELLLLLKPLAIKTSATNQLFGIITAILASAINIEVFVALKGGEKIVASLTLLEFEQLELDIGSAVVLLINAAEIVVLTDIDGYALSARNCLHGKIIRSQQDNMDSEIVIHLPSGDSLVVTTTRASAEALGFHIGMPVQAVFKSNAVILGTISHVP